MNKGNEPSPLEVSALRAATGMRADAFGKLVYASEASVYAWEAGRRACNATSWELLLIYFCVIKPRVIKTCDAGQQPTIEELENEIILKRVRQKFARKHFRRPVIVSKEIV